MQGFGSLETGRGAFVANEKRVGACDRQRSASILCTGSYSSWMQNMFEGAHWHPRFQARV